MTRFSLAMLAKSLTLMLLLFPSSLRGQSSGAWVFAYFKEPGNQGIYLALSPASLGDEYGYTFTPLNDGQPWIAPAPAAPGAPANIMRDVFVTHDPAGGYRMVWTWNWKGNSLGTAHSDDLVTWTPLEEVPIMQGYPAVRNVWAPETYWEEDRHDWLLLWSSSFNDDAKGNRIWSARTTDWKTFSPALPFYDPGFVVIDQTLLHRTLPDGKQDWVFLLKDQTADPLRYQVRWASGPTVAGPWSELSGPITESWSEGPSAIAVGGRAIVYYDHYRAPRARYEGVETTDWVHWTSVNDRMHFPEAAKHGSFFHVSDEEARRLEFRHDGTSPAAPPQ